MPAPRPECLSDVSLDICHWVKDGKTLVQIPGCMGAAVYGPESCTCDLPLSRIENAERRAEEAEELAGEFRDRLNHTGREYQKVLARNADLRRRYAELKRWS